VILKQVELDMVDKGTCQSQLRETKLGSFFRLHETFVCAGGREGSDTCQGDGGGPLICPVRDDDGVITNYVQTGIVAWGVECGKVDVPGVYASVSSGACFLNYAARCMLGKDWGAGLYGLDSSKCDGWRSNAVEAARAELTDLR